MDVAVLYSGGKDSNASLRWARRSGHRIDCLIGVIPQSRDSFMYHVPGTELLDLFGEAVGERLVKVLAPQEDELRPLKKAIAELKIDAIVSGAVRSDFQKARLDRIASGLSILHLSPLWHADPEKHVRDLISDGYDIIFTGVAAEGLDEGWLGRKLDVLALDALLDLRKRYGINVEGEGGEYETLVLFGPTHKKRIVIDSFRRQWHRDSGRIVIEAAHLE